METTYKVVYLKECAEMKVLSFDTQEEAISDFNTVKENPVHHAVDALEVWKLTPIPGTEAPVLWQTDDGLQTVSGPSYSWELITEWVLEDSL